MKDLRDLNISPKDAARLHDGFVFMLTGLGRIAPVMAIVAFVTIALQEQAIAGTSAVFDDLATETEGAVFGPLGQSVVFIGALAGGIIALLKGAWLFAAMGIAIAGLMYGSQVVAAGSPFRGDPAPQGRRQAPWTNANTLFHAIWTRRRWRSLSKRIPRRLRLVSFSSAFSSNSF